MFLSHSGSREKMNGEEPDDTTCCSACCQCVLIVFSWFLMLITFPFCLCAAIKVRNKETLLPFCMMYPKAVNSFTLGGSLLPGLSFPPSPSKKSKNLPYLNLSLVWRPISRPYSTKVKVPLKINLSEKKKKNSKEVQWFLVFHVMHVILKSWQRPLIYFVWT